MINKNFPIKTASYCLIPIIIIHFCLYLIMTGIASLSINFFGLDSNGIVYVALDQKIEVYDHNGYLRTISPQTSRSYSFTVLQNDTILLSTGSNVYTMDLYGNILSKEEDTYGKVFAELHSQEKKKLFIDGNKYSIKHNWARSKIVKNGNEIIYEISMLSFITKILLTVSMISVFALICIILLKQGETGAVYPSPTGKTKNEP